MKLKEKIMKLQTYKMYEDEDTVYVERDDVLKALEQQLLDCKTCKHSDNGNCAYTEECHECMWESKYEQQPCEDTISRQMVIDILKDTWNMFSDANDAMQESIDTIEALPSSTPEPKVGRWIHRENMDYLDKNKVMHNHFMCKDCGFIHDFIDGHTAQYKYCPSCGAKMQEVEE